ncbi:CHAT domain-containing protein [Mycena vulgaris]|nr:CHAT domain-containing protein [Mycena vulgaris]
MLAHSATDSASEATDPSLNARAVSMPDHSDKKNATDSGADARIRDSMPTHSDQNKTIDSGSDADPSSESELIVRLQALIKQAGPQDPHLPESHLKLGKALWERYKHFRTIEDLEGALLNFQRSVDLTPEAGPERAGQLVNLADCLMDQYRRKGDLVDLDATLKVEREALGLAPKGHSERANQLQSIAITLTDRYERLRDLKDLDAALHNQQEALDLTPVGHPLRATRLRRLARSLQMRYKKLRSLEDLEAAVQNNREALDLTPEGHPDRAKSLESLASILGSRHTRLGDSMDIEVALRLRQEATNLSQGANQLGNLSETFRVRFQKFGNMQDLDAALHNTHEALALTPEGHPDRGRHLINLGRTLRWRYERTQDLADLEAALQNHKEALALILEGHDDRATALVTLGMALLRRYYRLRDLKDLETALQNAQEAVDITPEGDHARPGRLRHLATCLSSRDLRSRDLEDLDKAVRLGREAVDLTPNDHPKYAEFLARLAVDLMKRYVVTREATDLTAMNQNFHNSVLLPTRNPQSSWNAALTWASLSKVLQPFSRYCVRAYAISFRRLPQILWMGHSISQRHETMRRLDIGQVTSTATQACVRLNDLTSAVELVEQGIATIFQQMLQLKTDPDRLDSDEAEMFRKLSSGLYSGECADPMQATIERNKLLYHIHSKRGLRHFLLPKRYASLSSAAQGGPIVILNGHKDSCDGIIVLRPTKRFPTSTDRPPDRPVHVTFPKVTLTQLQSQQSMLKELLGLCSARMRGQPVDSRLLARREGAISKSTQECFEDLLHWLWTCIVSRVYKVLKFHDIHGGRLWWLPTGSFTGLPLHASPPSDQFIHSYTATLGSLVDAYAKKANTTQTFGIVGVTSTSADGRNFLPSVQKEVNAIFPIIISPVERLTDKNATVDAVKQQLLNCSWVHLACHARQDLHDPPKSKLLLYGGDLELGTILRVPLPHAQFIFLAACQTAMVDEELANESFHLGGGFIAAGFRGAVGTLWSMHDPDGPVVAEEFYSQLFRNGRQPSASDAAQALHLAVKELKAQGVPYHRWVPFIHMGI